MTTKVEHNKPIETEVSQTSKKPSKIPVRPKIIVPPGLKKDISTEKLRKRTRSADKAVSASSTHHTAARARSRHGSDRERKEALSGSVGCKELKENLAPSLSSSSSSIHLPSKVNPKSNMSYMELKRRHQHLTSEMEAIEEKSREVEAKHFKQVHELVAEISQCKESNRLIREEINTYQAVISERNKLLDALQQRLDDVKFENERMAGILETSRLDAHTGERIERVSHFHAVQHEFLFDLASHEETLDDFISSLEATILQLQNQKNKTENYPVLSPVCLQNS